MYWIREGWQNREVMKNFSKERCLCKDVPNTEESGRIWAVYRRKEGRSMKRRSGIKVMGQLIGLIMPLIHVMAAAIFGSSRIFMCNLSDNSCGKRSGLRDHGKDYGKSSGDTDILSSCNPCRSAGILHYGEQACNHYIAFKLLAIIRRKVFAALRRLCPAKLEGKDKGNLISIITSDIELLEVFYAHTVSPIAIGFLTSLIMVIFIGHFHIYAGFWALVSYVTVGVGIPLWNGKKGGQAGMKFRNRMGN